MIDWQLSVDLSRSLDCMIKENRYLLNDRDRLPKQTINTKAEGNKGETRSINIPETSTKAFLVILTLKTEYKS